MARRALLSVISYSKANADVPGNWKRARLVPVLKPGRDRHLRGSYRPVALTSAVAKLAEAVILAPALRDLASSKNQTAYKKKRSAEDALAVVAHKISSARSRGRGALVVALDLESAVDRVERSYLASALVTAAARRQDGVAREEEMIIRWIGDFLSGGYFDVRVGEEISSPRDLMVGPPQGTLVGPYGWSIATEPLVDKSEKWNCSISGSVEIVMYADDLALIVDCEISGEGRREAEGVMKSAISQVAA